MNNLAQELNLSKEEMDVNKMHLFNRRNASQDVTISMQLTLNEVISELESVEDKKIPLKYDFGEFFPKGMNAWKGGASELAIGYAATGAPPTVASFLEFLKNITGKRFTVIGLTNSFVAQKDTPIWVANEGNVGHTAIMDVLDNEREAILITGFCEH